MKIILIVVLLTVGYIYGMTQLEFMRLQNLKSLSITSSISSSTKSGSSSSIVIESLDVSITGAVNKPGSYSIPNGSTLQELLILAGGLKENADIDAISLSYLLQHEDALYVSIQAEKKISINSAGVEELDTLSGIGIVLANKILEYRTIQGPFQSIESIMRVSGIGPSLFEKIKDQINLS